MSNPIDIRSLLEGGSPSNASLLAAIRNALEEAVERDLTRIRVLLLHYRIRPNGTSEPEQTCRTPMVPANSDAQQVAQNLIGLYIEQSPGNNFMGRIRIVFENGDSPGQRALGSFEEYVYIGEPDFGGDDAGMGSDPGWAPGGMPHAPMNPDPLQYGAPPGYGPMGGMGMEPDPNMLRNQQMGIEERGMALAAQGANERRLDRVLNHNEFLMNAVLKQGSRADDLATYNMQLVALVLNRALPALDVHTPQQGGGGGNWLAEAIGAFAAHMFGMGGGGQEEAPAHPAPPPPPRPRALPEHRNETQGYQPYQAPPNAYAGGQRPPVRPEDITPDVAQAWARNNPGEAKALARELAPPHLKKLLPK